MRLQRTLAVPALLALLSCIPEDISKPGWGLFPGAVGSNDTGSSPGVLVVGDSLVFGVGVQTVANTIRFFGGTSSVVAAAGGASTAHFNKEGLIGASGLSTIQQYVNFFGDLRVTVVALGSNDARIITGELGTMDGYTIDEFRGQAELAVSSALSRSRCVVLINVANHWEIAAPQVVDDINAILGELGTGNPKVRTADWNAFSAPHPEWFAAPNDIHHSDEGKDAYNGFITEAIAAAFRSGC
jgi:lysophospholipase L1-like esterase